MTASTSVWCPTAPVNAYRSGEKLVLRDGDYRDLRAVLDFQVRDGGHDVGLIFRVTRPAIGFDALRGYFVGLSTARNNVVLGAMDGRAWREIASAPVFLDPGRLTAAHRRRVPGPGSPCTSEPTRWPPLLPPTATTSAGRSAVRVVDTHAVFTALSVAPG